MKLGRVKTSRTSLGSCSLWKAVTHPSRLHLRHVALVVSDRLYASCCPVRDLYGGRQSGNCQYKSSLRIPSLVSPLSLACPMAHPQCKCSRNRLLLAHLQDFCLAQLEDPSLSDHEQPRTGSFMSVATLGYSCIMEPHKPLSQKTNCFVLRNITSSHVPSRHLKSSTVM